MTDNVAFVAALAHPDQPEAAMGALCALAQAKVGARLFTVMTFDATTRMARRVWSNLPGAYPVSGTKPAPDNAWTRCVLDNRQIFVANDADAIAAVFFDHATIAALGCASVLNLPIVVGGAVLGTLNLLDRAGHYTPERVAAAQRLALPGAACLLLQAVRGPWPEAASA